MSWVKQVGAEVNNLLAQVAELLVYDCRVELVEDDCCHIVVAPAAALALATVV